MSYIRVFLPEFIYGGIDGSITTFAVVAGATGADLEASTVVILGVANLIADGFSMSVGNYLSSQSNDAPEERSPIKTAVATFIAFQIVGIIPLIVYLLDIWMDISASNLFVYSCILTGIAFVIIGWLKSYLNRDSILKGIAETVSLAGIAAVLAYGAGDLLERALL